MSFLFLLRNSILLAFVVVNLGCGSLMKRSQLQGSDEGQTEFITQSPEEGDSEVVDIQERPVPKIAVIFGPGSVKALAHTGVMDAFFQEKVPVHSVVGIGWGALVGGYIASEGTTNEAQWELVKLKQDQLVKTEFLTKKLQRHKAKSFLKKSVSSKVLKKKVQDFSIPFACPTMSYLVGEAVFKNSGRFGSVLEKCLPTPPLFQPSGVWMADVGAVEESIRYLKQTGADIIVYLNVLGRGDLFSKKQIQNEPETALYWMQVRRQHKKLKRLQSLYPEFHPVNVNTGRQALVEVNNLRLLPLAGKRAGEKLVQQLKEKYNF